MAAVAAETARCAGLDVTITPCPDVLIHVGSPPEPVRCYGVQFDRDYLLVRLPTARWRALKIDPDAGSVVLRLACSGGYRGHVLRIFTALMYDRLQARRDRFEPQIALLDAPAAPVELSSATHPPLYPPTPRRKRKSSPGDSPRPVAEAPIPAPPPAPVAVAGPEVPARSAASPEPASPAAPAPTPRPARSAGPPVAPGGKARPLAGRVRR